MTMLSPEIIQKILDLNPAIREQIIAATDAQINELSAVKAAIVGSSETVSEAASVPPTKRRSAGRPKQTKNDSTENHDVASQNSMTHKEAVTKILAKKKDGVSSRELKKLAAEIGHNFGSSMGTTLSGMKDKKEVKIKPREKGSSQYLYFPA